MTQDPPGICGPALQKNMFPGETMYSVTRHSNYLFHVSPILTPYLAASAPVPTSRLLLVLVCSSQRSWGSWNLNFNSVIPQLSIPDAPEQETQSAGTARPDKEQS